MNLEKNNVKLRFPSDWLKNKKAGNKITIITAYDACYAGLVANSNIDAILVGDSLGMVVQGQKSTLPVTMKEMVYHSRMVRRGAPDSYMIVDLPFASYQSSIKKGVKNGLKMMKKTRADAVKLEGADRCTCKIISRLVRAGVPVVGHIGLTPQSYLNTSGFHVQGKTSMDQKRIIQEAKNLEEAGCFAVVLELMKSSLAKEITNLTSMVTIGIGAGIDVDAQVLVLHDVLGLFTDFQPRHVKKYVQMAQETITALDKFDKDVKEKKFPGLANSFQ